MENFEFKSQICTDKNKSERLLVLGLKPETADMSHTAIVINHKVQYMEHCSTPKGMDIPAWSLDRLKELYKCVGDTSLWNLDDVNYDRLILCIGLAIKHNSFNKEYLV